MTLLLKSWQKMMSVSEPMRSRHLARRVKKGKEDPARLCERYGRATISRSEGPMLWVHAASNGEALSALPLIDALRTEVPGLQTLVTTFTVTGAELIRKQAPHVIHQFKPCEDTRAIQAFLEHWHPDLALFVESEFWPNLLIQTAARSIPMAQVNWQLSSGSASGWRFAKSSFRELMTLLSARLVKTGEVKERMVALGLDSGSIHVTGDLKASRTVDHPTERALSELRHLIGSRPVFLAASTHPGEEEAVAEAHAALSEKASDLLTIIAPRHAVRGEEIAAMLTARGVRVARRSTGGVPEDAQIYLADTSGEMPLWYAVSPITYIGAGWNGKGGHNPLEAAQHGSAILSGPKVHASQSAYDRLNTAGALRYVKDTVDLRNVLLSLTGHDGKPDAHAQCMGEAAKRASAPDPLPLARTMEHLSPLIQQAFP